MPEDIPTVEVKLPIKLIIKRKGFEIFAEGTLSSIEKELDALADFADAVAEKLEIAEETPTAEAVVPSPEEISKTPSADVPVIKASRRTMDNLESLFNTPWGRTPRSVAEVIKALEVNAVPDRANSVAIYLNRLVQRGKLRRIEKEGKWAYIKLPE